ncbi:MAG: K(+)-stimulated pyrophosphate-energized sodium pump, partial [Oceanospirillaceae bacterium]
MDLILNNIIYILPLFGVVSLLYVAWKSAWVSKQEVGTDKMATIAGHIQKGAMAFLKAEYKVLAIFVVAVAILLAFKGMSEDNSSPLVALSFVVGAICSGLAG